MNIKIHYSFVIYIFILFFLDLLKYFAIFFISVLIHELFHGIIGYLYGLKIINIEIDMCGLSIKFEDLKINFIKKIVLFLAGPVVNLLIAIIIYYFYKEKYVFCILTNLGLFIFNMLPIYPLDGGKILYEVINTFFYHKKIMLEKIYTFLQMILLLILSFFCINYSNIQLFFLGIYFLKFTIKDKYEKMELF